MQTVERYKTLLKLRLGLRQLKKNVYYMVDIVDTRQALAFSILVAAVKAANL